MLDLLKNEQQYHLFTITFIYMHVYNGYAHVQSRKV